MLIHIIICLITICFFLYRFKEQGQIYQIYMSFWAFITMGIYLFKNRTLMNIFLVIQILLGVVFIYLYCKSKNYREQQRKKLNKIQRYLNNSGVQLYEEDIVE